MTQTATWTTTYRVPDWLASDTEDSIVGTQWHQEASSQLADMLRDVAARRGAAWGVCEWIADRAAPPGRYVVRSQARRHGAAPTVGERWHGLGAHRPRRRAVVHRGDRQ